MKTQMLSICLVVLLLVACGGESATPTAPPTATDAPTLTPVPTNTPRPTDTPEPTHTPTPTDTPEPTATAPPTQTPEPTPTPTPTDTPTPTATPEPTATATPTQTPEPTDAPEPTDTPDPSSAGSSRANPYPFLELALVPGWEVQVLETIRGDEAWEMIQAANRFNDPPPENMEYLLVKLHVKCTVTDDKVHSIGGSDFKVTGDMLVERRAPAVIEPDPVLDADLYSDGEAEGWAAYLVGGGESRLILIYDDLMTFDVEGRRFMALEEGAAVGVSPELADIAPNDAGMGRGDPAPYGELVTTEDWQLTVLEVVRGDDAWQMMSEASRFNDPPAEGVEFILVKLHVRYIGPEDQPVWIDTYDFESTGSANVLYDTPAIVEPAPILDVRLFPGGEYEGWVTVQGALDESSLMLVFEDESFRFLALGEEPDVVISPELADIAPTDLGKDRADPAPNGEPVTTEDWQLKVLEVIRGDDAWPIIEEASQFNDPPDEGMEYVMVRLHVRYIGTEDEPEWIDSFDFESTGSANVLYDTPSIVEPEPALDARLFPGGEYEGWVVVQAAEDEKGMMLVFDHSYDYSGENVRFLALGSRG